jgi:hypothetical protein
MSNRKTPNFAYGNFPTERDLISVKEFAYGSPKFFPTEKTFLNANIGERIMRKENNRFKPENQNDAIKLQELHYYEKKARAIRKLLFSKQELLNANIEKEQDK